MVGCIAYQGTTLMPLRGFSELVPVVVLVCLVPCAWPQEKAVPYTVRINRVVKSESTCTVVTQNGRVRREVRHLLSGGVVGKANMFEGIASAEDIRHVQELLAQPEFQEATKHHTPGVAIGAPGGQMIVVETELGNKPEYVAFVDSTGRTAIPPYLAGFVSFSDEITSRHLPKLTGKVQSLCKKLSVR